MSAGERIPLGEARERCARVFVALAGAAVDSSRISYAGSVRRGEDSIGDVEVVVVTRWRERAAEVAEGQLALEAPLERVMVAWEALEGLRRDDLVRPITPGGGPLRADAGWERKRLGARYLRFLLPPWDAAPLKLDVFLPDLDGWGWCLAVSTGPADLSAGLVKRWKAMAPGNAFSHRRALRRDGTAVDTPEEADVFRLLGLPHVPPAARSPSMLRRHPIPRPGG